MRVSVYVGDRWHYGPFDSRADALAWLERGGYDLDTEGSTFRIYELREPVKTYSQLAYLREAGKRP